jgi:hypothetical protein
LTPGSALGIILPRYSKEIGFFRILPGTTGYFGEEGCKKPFSANTKSTRRLLNGYQSWY